MLERPDGAELAEALAAFLENEVVPAFEGSRRFHALVAANVARILARELSVGPSNADTELVELRSLLGVAASAAAAPSSPTGRLHELASELCDRIDRGELDEEPARTRLLEFLKRSIRRRLAVDNPKFAD